MDRFDSLIVAHDLSPTADRILPVVGALARRASLPIRLVTAGGISDRAGSWHELVARSRRIHGAPVTPVAFEGEEPADAIADFGARHPAALLCLATHGRTALGEMLFGSVADEVLHRRTGPTLIIGPAIDLDRSPSDTLVVGVDSFSSTTPLVSVAEAWRSTFGDRIELVEVVARGTEETPLVTIARTLVRPPELGDMAASTSEVATTLIESHDPAAALVHHASTTNSVIAVASRLHEGLERALFGSVTWEIIRTSQTPVLVVAT